MVAENVPPAFDTAPVGDGTSWAAFSTVRIWMVVACGLADAPTVATSANASARAGMSARDFMNPPFKRLQLPYEEAVRDYRRAGLIGGHPVACVERPRTTAG
jgi:hypothetical protein